MSGIPTGPPGTIFSTDLTGAPAGATIEAAIKLYPAKTVVSAFSTADIVETPDPDDPDLSTYTATRTRPSVVTDEDEDGPRYAVVFRVNGVEQEPDFFWVQGTTPIEGLTPALNEVAALIRERTRGGDETGGRLLGTFTDNTDPTASQVEDLIADGINDVRTELGPELDTTSDEGLQARARKLAAIRTAMYVELSFFREQTVGDDTAYGRLKEMWDEGLAAMKAALRTEPGDRQSFGSVGVMSPTRSSIGAAGLPWSPCDFDVYRPGYW